MCIKRGPKRFLVSDFLTRNQRVSLNFWLSLSNEKFWIKWNTRPYWCFSFPPVTSGLLRVYGPLQSYSWDREACSWVPKRRSRQRSRHDIQLCQATYSIHYWEPLRSPFYAWTTDPMRVGFVLLDTVMPAVFEVFLTNIGSILRQCGVYFNHMCVLISITRTKLNYTYT